MATKHFCDYCGIELTEDNSTFKFKSICGGFMLYHFNSLCKSCVKKALTDGN